MIQAYGWDPAEHGCLREAAVLLFHTLDRLGIAYAVGGSFASSLHGVARATQDIDILLVKLLWYREGGETSERQWNDLSNLVAVQGGQLDCEYSPRHREFIRGVLSLHPTAAPGLAHVQRQPLPLVAGAPQSRDIGPGWLPREVSSINVGCVSACFPVMCFTSWAKRTWWAIHQKLYSGGVMPLARRYISAEAR
jgi:hypothetical protein